MNFEEWMHRIENLGPPHQYVLYKDTLKVCFIMTDINIPHGIRISVNWVKFQVKIKDYIH